MIIVVDTSSLQRFLAGIVAQDTDAVARAIAAEEAHIPPVVLTEALSNRFLDREARATYDDDFDNFVPAGLKLL